MAPKLIPPDGGWGWVIVFATSLSHFFIIPLMLNFGLVFRGIFDNLGFSHKDSSIIINTNAAFGITIGVINGALLKHFGYRKMAVVAGVALTCGVALTAFAKTFWQYFFFYGCITSFGIGMIISAYMLALNSYFVEKRNKAVSYAMAFTGLGTVITPQLINYLMIDHAPQAVILIIAGLCGHTIVAATLLQPVKWHLKKVSDDDEEELEDLVPQKNSGEAENLPPNERKMSNAESDRGSFRPSQKRASIRERVRSNSIVDSTFSVDRDGDAGVMYGFDAALSGSILSLKPDSYASINQFSTAASTNGKQKVICELEIEPLVNAEKSLFRRALWNVVHFLDLTLLCDLTYLNIMLGMSLAVFAEINFSTLTPFIFADKGLTISENASCLSILAIADIIFRFLAPYIGNLISKSPRILYMFSLSLLIVTRFGLIFCTTYVDILMVSIALGVARGVRTVYMNLVIPSHVPIHRLASANGIQTMVNGIFILIGAPILGFIRDVMGNYSACICIINCVTFSCILTWTTEIVHTKFKRTRNENAN